MGHCFLKAVPGSKAVPVCETKFLKLHIEKNILKNSLRKIKNILNQMAKNTTLQRKHSMVLPEYTERENPQLTFYDRNT